METGTVEKKVSGGKSRGGQYFVLWYVLSLIFGWGFIVALVMMVGFVVSGIMGGSDGTYYYPYSYVDDYAPISAGVHYGYARGALYAVLLTAVVVLGAVHLVLTAMVDKRRRQDEALGRHVLTVKIFGTIYNVGLALFGVGFLLAALYPLFALIVGVRNLDSETVAQMVTVGGTAVVMAAWMICHQVRAFAKLPKYLYAVVMGVVALTAMVLFLVFPVGNARRAESDQEIVDDLHMIRGEIERYVSEEGSLPRSLKYLDLGSLYRARGDYEYKQKYDGSKYDLEYTLCAHGFKSDTRKSVHPAIYPYFGAHKKGYDCFELRAHGRYYDYDDDRTYYNCGDGGYYNGVKGGCALEEEDMVMPDPPVVVD